MRIFSDVAAKNATTAEGLKRPARGQGSRRLHPALSRRRRSGQLAAVEERESGLQAHRNLDEDYCIVNGRRRRGGRGLRRCRSRAGRRHRTGAGADLVRDRAVLQSADPLPHPAGTARRGEAVEDIFNGPELESGFIKAERSGSGLAEDRAARVGHHQPSDGHRRRDRGQPAAADQVRCRRQCRQRRRRSDLGRTDNRCSMPNKVSASWLLFISAPASAAALPEPVALPVLQERPAVPAADGRSDRHAEPAARRRRAAEESATPRTISEFRRAISGIRKTTIRCNTASR